MKILKQRKMLGFLVERIIIIKGLNYLIIYMMKLLLIKIFFYLVIIVIMILIKVIK